MSAKIIIKFLLFCFPDTKSGHLRNIWNWNRKLDLTQDYLSSSSELYNL